MPPDLPAGSPPPPPRAPRPPAPAVLAPTPMPTASSYPRRLLRYKAAATTLADYVVPKVEAAVGGLRDLRERHDWETPAGVATTPTGRAERRRGLGEGTSYFPTSAHAGTDGAGAAGGGGGGAGGLPSPALGEAKARSRWGGITGYFSSGTKDKQPQSFEERVVSFPGWATLSPSAHTASEPALVLEVLSSGYVYRLRPLSQASRSQRVFTAIAKSYAALPKVPTASGGAQSVNSLETTLKDEETEPGDATAPGKVFESLVQIGESEGAAAEEEGPLEGVMEEPESMPDGEGPATADVPGDVTPIVGEPAKLLRRPRIETRFSHQDNTESRQPFSPVHSPSLPSLPSQPRPTPTRSKTTSTTASDTSHPFQPFSSPFLSSGTSTAPDYFPSVTAEHWPRPFQYERADLPRLHANLQARLVPFFGQKLGGRKVRLSIYPARPSGKVWDDSPLATKVVSTLAGGGWRTSVEVRSKALRKLLSEEGYTVEGLQRMQVRVLAELLEAEPLGADPVNAGRYLLGQGQHSDSKATAEDEATLLVGRDGGVRVISDIDDTVKWTQVLGGTKTIFRNVFVRELDEIRVPGMADWYRAMATLGPDSLGAHFHYVSNSPWELWPVVREFLSAAGFPSGSVTLKEYGGASSAIAKLWEEPGSRKRAGVAAILKEFPYSRFILIGDSGEQDLELYVGLARDYPSQILAIYIRDVTTPFSPDAHPNLSRPATSPVSTAPPTPAPAPPLVSPFSEFPDLPGQYDGSHERPFFGAPPFPSPGAAGDGGGDGGDSRAKFGASAPPSPELVGLDGEVLRAEGVIPSLDPSTPMPSLPAEDKIRAFYKRIGAAEKLLPEGVLLRIFRHGGECKAEAVELVRKHV